MVLLCDGRLVCGCADPYGKRVLGDLRTEASVSAVWTGERASSLRRDIVNGGSKFCGDCPLKLAGVQKRVETMLTMTGAQNFIEVHPDEPSAVKSFGA